jgi:hypothetical protein
MTACGLFFALFTRRVGTPADALPRGSRRRLVVAALLATVAPAVASAADLGRLADSGLAVVPADAAFVSASLRLREQYDRIVRSNAWAALRDLPGVKRALDSFEEQRSMPGSPVSMVDTFVELPENAQAVELLKDMVSRDTFVYGEPSCVAFVKLAQKLQQAQQMAGLLSGPERAGLDGFFEFEEEMEEEDELDDEEAGVARRPRVMPVAMQAGVDALTPEELQKRAVIEVLGLRDHPAGAGHGPARAARVARPALHAGQSGSGRRRRPAEGRGSGIRHAHARRRPAAVGRDRAGTRRRRRARHR